ncbi:hypothetical protein RND71_022591 [Anisodus tanguticus]|uniref:Uncharacterized protein n=1 Tax=Anisodus tanguticus TaxID=243964 RepID=A0AAE1VAW3_9SOLA|nr:hypothetical protein RND71_022591 [Anisodus tanguticus]
MVNWQPTDPKVVNDSEVEEMILELHKKVHKIIFEDSSSFLGEDFNIHESLELKRIRLHFNHFSTLCLMGDMEMELPEPMDKFGDEEQCVFILKFAMPRRQNGMPHLRAKKCKMRHLRVGLFACLTPPYERHHNLDSKMERKFMSSKRRGKW